MKDKILATHPILGIITFKDIIRDLEIMLKDNIFLENIIDNILKETEMEKEDIASLFNYSITNRLKWMIDVLKSKN